jgi:hypothetical protein
MDWITKLRKQRIEKGIPKYGPWDPSAFTKRNPLSEAIDEGIDLLNYIEMSEMCGKISEGLKNRLTFDVERVLNILKLNE